MSQAGDIHPNPGPLSTYDLSLSSESNSDTESMSIFSDCFSIVHYNVQSLRSKIDVLGAELCHFDILAFSESWLGANVSSDDILLHNFNRPERKDRARDFHGGVIIYVKDSLYHKRMTDLEIDHLERIWIGLYLHRR